MPDPEIMRKAVTPVHHQRMTDLGKAMTHKTNGKAIGKNKMPVVGVRVPSWASFTRPIFHGIVDFISNREPWRIQTLVDSTNEMAPMVIDENWNGDGLILFRHSADEAAAFKRRGIPVVNLSTECREKGFPTVIPDNEEIGRMAAQHLLTLGLQHFSYWGDPSRTYSRERGEAFERRITEAGFHCINTQFEPDNLPWEGRWVNVRQYIIRELQHLPKPIGIFAKDDMLGSNIIRICNEQSILVPEEISVIGTNADEVFCQICTPPLSSVAYPGERVGYQAASLLSGMMHGAGVDDDYVMPIPIHELVARESTNTLAVDDPIVADAVHHIRSQAAVYPIRVSEIVARSRLSHSGFNKNFFRQMGHTPKEEIKRVRLLHLQALLKNTGTRISQIARKMRFESPEELTRFFKRETGFAPKDYRNHYHPSLH